jgi:uncharacterized membrane protein
MSTNASAGSAKGSEPKEPRPLSTNEVNALIHLYRAEMGRMTAYRARLDTTTNWAITATALVTTFVFGSGEHTHVAILFLMAVNYFFLHLEARRFGAYEGSRRRVRLLEVHFYGEVLGERPDILWLRYLIKVLRNPVYPTVPLLMAMSWRLRRVYLWIYIGVLLAWLGKLDVDSIGELTLLNLVARAGVGSTPGWLVCLGVALLYAWLLMLTARGGRNHPLGNPYAQERVDTAP